MTSRPLRQTTLSSAPLQSVLAAPGGGAACGVVIALATACALKAVVMTLKHHPDDPELTAG